MASDIFSTVQHQLVQTVKERRAKKKSDLLLLVDMEGAEIRSGWLHFWAEEEDDPFFLLLLHFTNSVQYSEEVCERRRRPDFCLPFTLFAKIEKLFRAAGKDVGSSARSTGRSSAVVSCVPGGPILITAGIWVYLLCFRVGPMLEHLS